MPSGEGVHIIYATGQKWERKKCIGQGCWHDKLLYCSNISVHLNYNTIFYMTMFCVIEDIFFVLQVELKMGGGAVVYWIEPLWIKGFRVRFPSMPDTFVLQQGTLSTLLLSTQVYKWVPGRMRTLLWLSWHYVRLWNGDWPECSPGSGGSALWVQNCAWILWPG